MKSTQDESKISEAKHHDVQEKAHMNRNHGKMDHSHMDMDHEKMDHSHMNMDHGKMDHSHMDMGHGGMDHSMHMGNLKQKFWISLVLAIPILLLSPMMGLDLPFQFEFPGSEWVVLILATILFFYGGMPFLQGAKMELAQKEPAMMTLISLGISVSYLYSLYAFIMNNLVHSSQHIMDFFWELATLIVIMLLGHWIEMNAISNAGNALEKMAELLPGSALVVDEAGNTKEVDLQDVQTGQHLLVKAGEKVPTDGTILSGETSINESMVTGESKEIAKSANDTVIGGSVNGSGTITIEVTGTGESGYLSQVMALVSSAQNEKSRVESLSDKVAKWLFYIALGVGILAFIIWQIVAGDLNTSLERMVTVFIIACPHALGLAIPLVTARSTSLGAQNGVLIKDRNALEAAKKIDTIVMDKTGTLTEGNFAVNDYRSLNDNYSSKEVLTYLAALEQNSSHPLSVGILKEAKKLKIKLPSTDSVSNLPGVGLEGTVDKKKLKIVNVTYLREQHIDYDQTLVDDFAEKGNSISFLLENEQAIGFIAQGDQIKSGAKAFIQDLENEGIRPVMLTGDNEKVAESVGKQLGIKDVHAELKPEDKAKLIKDFKKKGESILMVGDGVNDAPSLASATVGVAIGAGTDVAIDSADVILVNSDPSDIRHFLSLAKNTQRKMVQNLWWGAGYNIIAIPLAAGILAPWGLILSPAVGAILMSLSTVVVAINAMLLKID